MKKLLLIVPLAAVLTGCANKNNATSSDAENTEEKALLVTPDLSWADVKGPVKNVTITSSLGEMKEDSIVEAKADLAESKISYGFDKEGRLTDYCESSSYNGEESSWIHFSVDYATDSLGTIKNISEDAVIKGVPINLKRDAANFITTFEFAKDTDMDFQRIESYTWKDSKIASVESVGWEWYNNVKYTYDENGNIASADEEGGSEGESSTTVTTYKYLDFDSYGNWTRRTVTYQTSIVSEFSDSPTAEKMPANYQIQTRTIEYFE